MSDLKIYESKTLILAMNERVKDYQCLIEQLDSLSAAFHEIVQLSDFKGKTADAIKGFYLAQIDVINAWKAFIEQHISFIKKVENMLSERNLSGNTLVYVPFLEETLKNTTQKANQIVYEKEQELKRIFHGIDDIISLTAFSSQDYFEQMHNAEKERKDTLDKVYELDYQLAKEYKESESAESYVNQLYQQILRSSNKDGITSPIYFNSKAYHNSEIFLLKKEQLEKWAKETNGIASKGKSDKEDITVFSILGGVGKYAITAQSLTNIALVWGKQVQFLKKEDNEARAVIHTAKWIKGKGINPFFKKLARTMDKSIRNPGPYMKGLMKVDGYIEQIAKAQIFGISKAKSFDHFVKTVVAGVKEDTHGIETSKIPKMITKRIYPLDFALNVAEEGWNLQNEYKKGKLDGKDWAVSGSNIVIKTGATTAGALIGGTIGALGGPAGAAVGTYLGGMAGAWLGDSLASIAEDAIRKGPKAAMKNAGSEMEKSANKGFNWVKGVFK